MQDFLLGTSGYDYPEWKGVFYPPDLKRQDFLTFYSTVFNALELNFSFYGMPMPHQMRSFYERSEGRLSFSVKANRALTHEAGRDWKETAREFQQAVKELLEKDALCAVLFQFPEHFHYTRENRLYLADLLAEFNDFPCVVEFRHRDWVRESVFAGLEERGAGLVFCDMPKLGNLPNLASEFAGSVVEPVETTHNLPFFGKTAYIRLHGRNALAWYSKEDVSSGEQNGSARYRYDYSDDELREFVPVIQSSIGAGKRTAVFFNNHPDGSGARNAKRLGEMMGILNC
ncbi:MAG: DUF72 domain-containing protein [Treponema sp.]|nr:DUF72 domain-containing protein [Treponema sp.]